MGAHIVGSGPSVVLLLFFFFMKAIRLFRVQGLKVSNCRRTIRGPNKVDMRQVNQGEELNQPRLCSLFSLQLC